MTAELTLRVRTPAGLLIDAPVRAIRAEDFDGWFGILPGRADLVAALPPGLLAYRDAEGEGFVAHAGGLLDLRGPTCRVAARDAVATRDLDEVTERLAEHMRSRAARAQAQRDVLDDLAREALRRVVAWRRR